MLVDLNIIQMLVMKMSIPGKICLALSLTPQSTSVVTSTKVKKNYQLENSYLAFYSPKNILKCDNQYQINNENTNLRSDHSYLKQLRMC